MLKTNGLTVVLGSTLALTWCVTAQEPATPAKGDEPATVDVPTPSVTSHVLTLDGERLPYTATAGTLPLAEEDGTKKADVFFVAYERRDAGDAADRPITFCFNGGPGSSSVWLHLGGLGPRRVAMGDAGALKSPPWEMVDSDGTLLDITDLVFIDPVTTGYSRAAEGQDDGQFHGVDEDVASVADFIRLYTTRFERWRSPKFLAGESYGTTRAAGLAGHLQRRHGMYLDGVIMVSAILDFQTARFDRGNDLPYVLILPTYTATAWYHGRLEPELMNDLEATLAEAEAFALGPYATALLQGDDLDPETRRQIVVGLSRFTGLPPDFIEASNLRVSLGRFDKELLRDERRTVGRLDSRFVGIDVDAAGERPDYDPSYAAIQGPFTAMLNDYVRVDLKYESDLNYEILTGRVHPWSYGSARNQYLNVAETLRSAMTMNRDLRVFFAAGYYDAATPYFAAEHTISHLGLEPALRHHVEIAHYRSGHMMYIHDESRLELKRDIAAFYGRCLADEERADD